MRILCALAAGVAAVVAFPAAAAASPQARLVYGRAEGADACPDESTLRHAVAARIGYDPFFPSAPRTVIVVMSARGDQLVARLQLVDDESHAQGASELVSSGRDCASLFDTVALTVSIAIDPQALAKPAPPAAAPAPPPPAPALPLAPLAPRAMAPIAGESPEDADAPPHALPLAAPSARFGVALRSSLGLEPSPAFGFAISGAALWRHASLGAEGAVDLPASKSLPSGESVSTWLLSGALVPCLRFTPVALCGLATVGRLQASASGVLSPHTPAAAFVAFGGRVGVEVPVSSRVAFEARADLLANPSRATLRIGSSDPWEASAVAGVLALGAVASF